MILVKNIFPEEFDHLQENRGYIYHVLSKIDDFREEWVKKKKEEVLRVEEDIRRLEENVSNSLYDAIANLIPSSTKISDYSNDTWAKRLQRWSTTDKNDMYPISYQNYSSSMTFDEFVDRFITREQFNILKRLYPEETKKESLKKKINEARKIDRKIENVGLMKLSELFHSSDAEYYDNVFLVDEKEFAKIKSDYYFPLIQYLIVDGLIDETYWHYKGYFYEGSLGYNEVRYMKNPLEGKEQDLFLELFNPKEVFLRLSPKDYQKSNVLNKSLLQYMIREEKATEFSKIADSVVKFGKYKEICLVVSSFEVDIREAFVSQLFLGNDDMLLELVDYCNGNGEIEIFELILNVIYCLPEVDKEKLERFNPYLNNYPEIFISMGRSQNLFINLEKAGMEFAELNKVDLTKEVAESIERIKGYKLSVSNVHYIASKILASSVERGHLLSAVKDSPKLENTKSRINNHYSNFVVEYVSTSSENTLFSNDQEELLKILIMDTIPTSTKIDYLNKNIEVLLDIKQLGDLSKNLNDGIIQVLMEKNTLDFSKNNFIAYWEVANNYNAAFLEFIDRNRKRNDFLEVLRECTSILKLIIVSPELPEDSFNALIEIIELGTLDFVNEHLSDKRMEALISKKAIKVTDEILRMLLEKKYYNSILMLIEHDPKTSISCIINNIDLIDLIDENSLYKIINSDIEENHTLLLLENMERELNVEQIEFSKIQVLSYLLSNSKLKKEDVVYAVLRFEEFPLKEELLKYISENYGCEFLINEKLGELFLIKAFESHVLSEDDKVILLVQQIEKRVAVDTLRRYLSLISCLDDLYTFFDGARPLLDNPFKVNVAKSFEKNGIAIIRSDERIQLKSSTKRMMKEK